MIQDTDDDMKDIKTYLSKQIYYMLAIGLYTTKNYKTPHGTHNMKLLLLLAQI
jgi:hydroxymethylpyrimidine/phosphomethylpyrimidine kinase